MDNTAPPEGDPPGKNRWKALLRWMRAHKLKTLLLLVLLYVLAEAATIPWFSVGTLRTENPGETALMRQRRVEAERIGKKFKVIQQWVPLSRISRSLVDAVVVAEDGTFYTHGGIDWFEVRESIQKNVESGRAARGASTITQQLAKNLYLSTSKDPMRKLKELVITLLLEQKLGKERILEIYLNVIEWGSGVFGAEAASRAYFGKSAASLTLDEALRLAAVIPSPLRHRADEDTRYVLRRSRIISNRLVARRMGHVTDEPMPDEELDGEPSDSVGAMPPDTAQKPPVDTARSSVDTSAL